MTKVFWGVNWGPLTLGNYHLMRIGGSFAGHSK